MELAVLSERVRYHLIHLLDMILLFARHQLFYGGNFIQICRMFTLLVQGKWTKSSNWNTIVDPLNGEPFVKVADVNEMEIQVLVSVVPSSQS